MLVSCNNNTPDQPGDFQVVKFEPSDVSKTNSMELWAHFMPWFENKESSADGKWGMHWTMSSKNPDNVDQEGKREIASHYYPLTGPYASSDHDIIEYQLLLMKYSGIDGILIDWYGSSDINDYGSNRRNSEAIINSIGEVGLKFAIVYEDQTIAKVVENDNSLDETSVAQSDMTYIEQNYFNNPSYITIDNKPLLLVFGPQTLKSADKWGEVFSVISKEPCFLTLNGAYNLAKPYCSGEYIWVDNSSLDNKYAAMKNFGVSVAGAYPGFNDFYKEGGWGDGFTWNIDFKEGETLRQNLLKAKNANARYVQLITWNDYGEGTIIEPTLQYGNSLLEIVQDFSGVNYTAKELEKIMDLYNLRKKYGGTSDNKKYLDQAFYYLVSLQQEKAFQLTDSLKNINSH
jgi:hypothetical protein